MTEDEIMAASKEPGMEDAVLVGEVSERNLYFPAITGYSPSKGVFIYDGFLLAECFAEEFRESDRHSGRKLLEDDEYMTEAMDWIDVNVIGSLPNVGEHAPVIIMGYGEDEDED